MDFSMEIPDTEKIKEEIIKEVKPESEDIATIKKNSDNNVEELKKLDISSLDDRRAIIKTIDSFGKDILRNSAKKSSSLQFSVGNLANSGGDGSIVAKGLVELQHEIKDLDPSVIDFAKKGVLSKIFNPVRRYFEKYQKADDVINDIMKSLEKGKLVLKNDNTTLEIEEISLRDLTKKLNKSIEMGTSMDDSINNYIQKLKINNEDPDKIKFITEELLFPLRQRVMDMQQMIVVNHQGIIAMEVLRRNNKELIRGVDRAQTVTISALRIGVLVAKALNNQKIVLKKSEMVNTTTNNIISTTSKMLKEQGTEIHKQSMDANITVDTLRTAFEDCMSAIDAISTYKQEALPKMKEIIDQFKQLAEKGEKQIQRLEKGSQISIS